MTSFRFSSFVMTCLLLASPALAMAQGFQIDKVLSNGLVTTVVNDPAMIRNILVNEFNAKKGKMQDAIRLQLGAGNLIAKGVTLYNVNVQIGTPQIKFLSTNQVEMVINGNHLYAKSTTPTSLGKWADPAFELNFNVRGVVTFSLPTRTDPRILVTSAVVEVPWAQLKSRNVTGGVAMVAALATNFFIKTFKGRDLIKEKLTPFLSRDLTSSLNSRLAPINTTLRSLASNGFKNPEISKLNDQVTRIMMKVPKPIKSTGKAKVPATK